MRIKFFLFILFFTFTCGIRAFGQRTLLFGMRDNEYARIGYQDRRNWYVIAEHSVFVTKLKNQAIHGYAGYKGEVRKFEYNGCMYGGLNYAGGYRMAGVMAEVDYSVLAWWKIFGGIRPHYDTAYGYDTALKAGVSFALHKDIAFRGEFTSYPEYRLCEKRIKAGLDFNVKGLKVSPEISVPVEGNLENIRLIMGFKYELSF